MFEFKGPGTLGDAVNDMVKKMREQEKAKYIVCLDFYPSHWGNRDASNSEIIGEF